MPLPETRDLPRLLLRDAVYVQLRRAVIDGALRPGEPLRDDELAGQLGLSRTPVREALARLEHEGLVESAPNRYTRVSTISSRDAADAFPVAAALHALSADLAARVERPIDMGALRQASERLDWAMWRAEPGDAIEADEELHSIVLAHASNGELVRLLDGLAGRVRRLEWHAWSALGARTTSAFHARLMAALDQGDAATASDAARDEWLELGRLAEAALAQAERRSSMAISER